MNYGQQLGEMIKKARKKKSLELKKLAELLTISCFYVQDIELGKVLPSVEELKKISRILDINVDIATHENELAKNPLLISKGEDCCFDGLSDVTDAEWDAFVRRVIEINS